MAIKYTTIFDSQALPNIPELVFLVVKIWHLATLQRIERAALLERIKRKVFFVDVVFISLSTLQNPTTVEIRLQIMANKSEKPPAIPWSQSYDFWIYNYNASVVVD
jgi:hypothetical protein